MSSVTREELTEFITTSVQSIEGALLAAVESTPERIERAHKVAQFVVQGFSAYGFMRGGVPIASAHYPFGGQYLENVPDDYDQAARKAIKMLGLLAYRAMDADFEADQEKRMVLSLVAVEALFSCVNERDLFVREPQSV